MCFFNDFRFEIEVVLLPSSPELSAPQMTHWCFLYLEVMLSVLTSPVRKGRGAEELGCFIGEDGFPQLRQLVLASATSDVVS